MLEAAAAAGAIAMEKTRIGHDHERVAANEVMAEEKEETMAEAGETMRSTLLRMGSVAGAVWGVMTGEAGEEGVEAMIVALLLQLADL